MNNVVGLSVPGGLRRALLPVMLATAALCLGGCLSFLKPAEPITRHLLLAPVAGSAPADAQPVAIGLGRVRVPAYLNESSIAIRRGGHEIEYAENAMWAERLEGGMQRVLAANLTTMLPAATVRLDNWSSRDVAAEIQIHVEQFDVDLQGQGVLVAGWRILSPGGTNTLKAARTRLTRSGPGPAVDPPGAVGTLSQLLGEFSKEIAQALRNSK